MKNSKISKGIKYLIVIMFVFIVNPNVFAQFPLRDSIEFQPRNGLPNFFNKIKNKEPIEVGFIGGSITQVDGWSVNTLAWLKDYYQLNNVTEHNIAIGGTDSKYGVFRIDNELLDKYSCDLIFVEFAVNDDSWISNDILKSMEGIVRKIWEKDPYMDICFVYTFQSDFFDEIEIGKMNLTASMHDTIASYYNIPSIFWGVEAYKSLQTGLVVWEDEVTNIFTSQNESGQYVFTSDGVHPTNYGHQIYTDVISKSFKKIDTLNIKSAHELIMPLTSDNYENAKMSPVTVPNNHGFDEIDSIGELSYLSVYLDNAAKFLVSSDNADYYSFSFKGKEIGLNMIIGPTGGKYIVEIDGESKEYEAFTGSCSMFLKYANYIKVSEDVVHKVKIYPSESILTLAEKRNILSDESQKLDLDNNPEKYNKSELIFSDILLTGEITNFYNDTVSICRGDSVIWQNKTYKTAGEYYAIYQSSGGLDSIYQLNVNTYVQYYIEQKDTINFRDSLFWEGAYYKKTGDYVVTYPSTSGCDSVLVLKLVVNDSPYLSEYLFEEPTGLTVIDSRGSNNGTLTNTVERVSGARGNGLKLTGEEYVDLGKCFGDEVSDEVTLSAWLKPDGTSGSYQGVVLHGSTSLDNYALYINPELKSVVFRTRNTSPFVSEWMEVTASILWDGNWHQLTATYNGEQKVIYLDGVALRTMEAIGNIESGSGYNLYIGAGRSLTSWDMYKGLIDEVRIYNYGLTAAEIPVPDLVKPVVTSFTISTESSTLVVPLTSFSATDNRGITGYKLTESVTAPLSTDGGWEASAPLSYTFGTEGTKTLYAWAKDAAGNVSDAASSQVVISLPVVTDHDKPVITSFTLPSESSTLVVSVTSFAATDNTVVTGYKLTESVTAPLPTDGGWEASVPLSYTFATEGTKTLYAWAKDAAGNVSDAASSQVVISLPVVTDHDKPVIISFTLPSESSTLVVSVTSFAATDNTAVTGYKLTESVTAPLPTDGGWEASVPLSYTFATEGTKPLYAWAKDAAGNVSDAASSQVIIKLPVSSFYSEYLFEEPGGLTVLDSKGSNNGTLINTVERVSGVRGNGLKMTGAGYVNLGKCFGDEVSNAVTLSAWIKPDKISGSYQGVVLHGSASLDNYAIYINPDLKRVVFRTRNTVPSASQWMEVAASVLWDGNWHHVTATYNGTQKVIYVDGVALKTANASGNIESGSGYNLYIGAGRSLTSWDMYKGLIDEVMICNYGLTSPEITNIFNGINQTTLKNMEIPEDIKVEASSEDDFNSVISSEKIYLINDVTDFSQNFDFTMYPNPANSLVNIDFGLMPGIESAIELIDQNGRVIQSKKIVSQRFVIDLNNYSPGVYYLRFKNDKLQKTKKLIIKN